jgi:uncharacterized protein (TIGR00369 family)
MKKQPNSLQCFICGIENPVGLKLKVYEIEEGIVESFYTAPEHFQGYPGILHGGIVAAILDEMCSRALMGDNPHPRLMVTGKLEVRYRRNVPIGKPLKLVGKAGKSKRKMAESWAGIYDEMNELLAEANAILIDIPQNLLPQTNLNNLGWEVYPD